MFEFDPYYSAHPDHASDTLEEPYKKSADLVSRAWKNEKVLYHYNKYGFRCDDFKQDNNICFVGCSITLGTGLNIEDTFSHIVSKELGLNNCNLGKAGGSMDSMFRIAYYWLPKLKPKITVVVATNKERSEFFNEEYKIHEPLLPRTTKNNKWYLDYLRNENNCKVNFEKNKYALHFLCNEINSKMLWFEHGIEFGYKVDLAKDLMHPGKKSNRLMADEILECIKDIDIT